MMPLASTGLGVRRWARAPERSMSAWWNRPSTKWTAAPSSHPYPPKANRDLLPLLRRMSQLMFTDEDRLEDMVKHIKGQCIVFCSYRKEMDYLRKRLNCYAINGDTQDRECIMERFKNDDKPLLIMFGIGAFGHNMQYCNRVMFSSLTFDYGKIDQAKHRIKRIGQERDIEYTIFTSRLGLFKMIEDNLEKKQELHQLVQQELEGDNFECL